MNDTTLLSNEKTRASRSETVRVWDPVVRLFHWSLAAGFAVAFLAEDDLLAVHVRSGYIVLGLILIRLLWGMVGPQHARWSDFVKSPAETAAYIQDAIRFKAARHLGHNPAGGAMAVALVVSLAATGLTGLAVYGAQELSGPLAPVLGGLSGNWGHALEDVHEVLADMTLLLVIVHLAGVAFASLQHRENLVLAMITGLKRRQT